MTAKEIAIESFMEEESGFSFEHLSVVDRSQVIFAMKRFAQMHCKAQAEAIIKIGYSDWVEDPEKAIQEAYPLTNIK